MHVNDIFMHNNELITVPKTIVDGLNSYFVNISQTLSSTILVKIFTIDNAYPTSSNLHHSQNQHMK